MSKFNRLTLEFAAEFPHAFAARLAQYSDVEAKTVLDELAPDCLVAVLGGLPVERLESLALDKFQDISGELKLAHIDQVVTFMLRLPVTARTPLIANIGDRGLRRRLRQRLNYGAHTVGALVTDVALSVSADTPMFDVLADLRTRKAGYQLDAIVVDQEGRYLGVLDTWKVLMADPVDGAVQRYIVKSAALPAEMSITDAQTPALWRHAMWLPVVDPDNRVLGVVHREDLLSRIEHEEDTAEVMATTFADLAALLWVVMSDFLSRILTAREFR